MEPIIFMFCLTLHNIEEVLSPHDWISRVAPKSRKPDKRDFLFALLGVTVLGYLAAGLHALYPDNQHFELAFAGFVGAMLINAIMPHLYLTARDMKYCPGVFTGCFLIIPFHLIILNNAVNSHLKVREIMIATLVVGAVLLVAIRLFELLARKIFRYS